MKKFLLFAVCVLAFGMMQAQNPGDLDEQFGDFGTFVTDFADDPDSPTATFVLSDGKILTVGNTWINYSSFLLLTRHHADGSIDLNYGTGGKLCFKALEGGNNYAWDAVLLDDESVIVAGHAFVNPRCNVILTKITRDGYVDTSFGNNGYAHYSDSRNFVIKACGVQSDGKIVLGGYCEDNFCALRFNADGSLDTSFANGGLFYNEMGMNDSFVESLAIQEDDKIVLAGWGIQSHAYNFYESIVARLDADGNLDTSFGNNGYLIFDIGDDLDSAHDVEVMPDGKILINGYYHIYQEGCLRYAIYLNRRNADGSPDTSFGSNGLVLNECVSPAENYSEEMLIAEDGTIFCTGNTRGADGGEDLLVSSFTADGEINMAFGEGGHVVVEFDANQSESRAMAIQPDGLLVVSGIVFDNNGSSLMLARFYTGVTTSTTEDSATMVAAYPNPVSDVVRFNSIEGQAFVYDMTGRLVMSSQLVDGSLNVASLSQGSYIVRIQNGEDSFMAKFVK
ncbi:MAG: T9SS type A sorting domain-containing protein [Bacteroidales bacterium]|nr:T9SS type A sorting domain-containing protein [Bacteroidales bacterium]